MGAMAWSGGAAGMLAVLATACTFDATAPGDGGAAGSTGGETTSGTTITSTSIGPTSSTTEEPSDGTMPVTTVEPESTAESAASTTQSEPHTETSSSTDSGSTTDDECEEFVPKSELLWVQDLPAAATMDMELLESGTLELDGRPVIYARSLTADLGSVEFEFDTDCEDELYVYGLVFDWVPSSTNGPDSYWYGLDDDATAEGDAWVYGCTTAGLMSGWSWQPLRRYDGSPCDTEAVVPTIGPGPHTFMLLNREWGSTGFETFDFAGVAALMVTNDPAHDPYDDYMP